MLVFALSAEGAVERIRQMDVSGFLMAWMPELEELKGVRQPKEHYWDVYEHSLQTVVGVETVVSGVVPDWSGANLDDYLSQSLNGKCSRLVLLKLGALLHDVAKPQTKSFDATGRMRFFGHASEGALTARRILLRLGFSSEAQAAVGTMIEHHLRPGQLSSGPEWPTERALNRFFRDTATVSFETLLLNLADHRAMRGPLLADSEWQQHVDWTRMVIEHHLSKQGAEEPVNLVNGHEVMAELGLRPGPTVGKLLASIREAQARGDISSRAEAFALARRILAG